MSGVPLSHRDSRWKTWAVTGLLFSGLLACLILLIKLIPELQLGLQISAGVGFLLLLTYSVAVGLSAILWRNMVLTCTGAKVAWPEALVGIAALMLGKYLPGKVAGLTGRLLTISAKTGLIPATLVTVVEQGYMLAGLILFSALASIALPGEAQKLWALSVPVIGVVIALAPRFCEIGLQYVWKQREFTSDLRTLLGTLNPLTSLGFLAVAVAIAMAVCAPAWLLPNILSIELSLGERSIMVAAYSISIVAGMMALILPGGIGVREGAFVLMTQSILTLEVAIAAAALLRLINVVADLLIGCLGFTIWKINYERL